VLMGLAFPQPGTLPILGVVNCYRGGFHMEILQIAATLLVAELVMWELPQSMAKRMKWRIGMAICLGTSLAVAGLAFWTLSTSQQDAFLPPGVVSLALFILFAFGSSAVFWYEKRRYSQGE